MQRYLIPGFALALALLSGPTQASTAAGPVLDAPAIDLRSLPQLSDITRALTDERVVFVAESHDQYAHHLVQLAIIRALHQQGRPLAIGLEQFQIPFQEHLDAYVAGTIDEPQLLKRTEYLSRWRFDFRLYRPILAYAREHRIPLVALNIPAEMTRKVAEGGLSALSEEERALLPQPMGEAGADYLAWLKGIFGQHPGDTSQRDFERFVQAQLLWDEGMAARAATYLNRHPETRLVVLAGSGHVARRFGIPSRLERLTGIDGAVVVNGQFGELGQLSPEVADFLVLPPEQPLPPKGMLGILMEAHEGGVVIEDFSDVSPARRAGLEQGDRLIAIAGQPVGSVEDVKLILLDAQPGDSVQLRVKRPRWLSTDEEKTVEVTLATP